MKDVVAEDTAAAGQRLQASEQAAGERPYAHAGSGFAGTHTLLPGFAAVADTPELLATSDTRDFEFGSAVLFDSTGYSSAASWELTDSTVTGLKLDNQFSRRAANMLLEVAGKSAAVSLMDMIQASDMIVLRWVDAVHSDSMTECDLELVVVGSTVTV